MFPFRFLLPAFAAAALPVQGAGTYTPDPSLGNPAQHVRLYEIGRNYLDTNFDPAANLVGASCKTPPNKKQHATVTSACYVYTLLLTGDPDDRARAQAVLANVLKTQDTDPGSKTYGVFGWYTEDKPNDLNAAQFIGMMLANIIDLDRRHPCLDADLRKQTEQAFRMAVEAVLRRDVEPSYTNIAMMSVAVTAAGQKLFAIPKTGEFAQSKLDAVLALAGPDGEFAEYLSPTYYGAGMNSIYSAQKFAFNDAFAAKTKEAIDKYWKQIALAYDAPTCQLGGPFCRSYGENMLDYTALLKYFLYLGLDGNYPMADTDTSHDWDKAALGYVASLPIAPRSEFTTIKPPAWREWDAPGSNNVGRKLRQFRDQDFILGTVALQDEWAQKRNLVAYWRNPGQGSDDFHVGFCLDESNDGIAHFPGQSVHFNCTQVKDAAVVALSTNGKIPGDNKAILVFDDGAAPGPSSTDGTLQIQDGTRTAYLLPITSTGASFQQEPDPAHHVVRWTRAWSTADNVGPRHVIAYAIVFRPSGQPAPAITAATLSTDGTSCTAAATIDGSAVTVSFK